MLLYQQKSSFVSRLHTDFEKTKEYSGIVTQYDVVQYLLYTTAYVVTAVSVCLSVSMTGLLNSNTKQLNLTTGHALQC